MDQYAYRSPGISIQNIANIYDFGYDELVALIHKWGEPEYRASQLWDGLYKQLWTSADEFTSLQKTFRLKLDENFSGFITDGKPSFTNLNPSRMQKSTDGETIKTLFTLRDGKQVEAVLMRYEKRRTLCISTQAGCAMGCVFCATGQMGFRRNLSSGEIVEQGLYYARQVHSHGERVTNAVLRGMGEPFHNYDATMEAIDRLNHPEGFNLGARRFTVSTVGLVPLIRRFANERRQINLAVSLHAADDDLRSSM